MKTIRTSSAWLTGVAISMSSVVALYSTPTIAAPIESCVANQCTVTLAFTGSWQDWTVPDQVTSINVELSGSSGGNTEGGSGGFGGRVNTTLAVSSGEVLRIYLGTQGLSPQQNLDQTYPGVFLNGGRGGADTTARVANGASGGSGSEIRTAPFDANSRLVVAGAGGGAAAICGDGGNGGQIATAGTSCGSGVAGGPATVIGGTAYTARGSGMGLTTGQGGSASSQAAGGSGGGGGGKNGGGAGSAKVNGELGAGGGGGSSWTHQLRATQTSFNDGVVVGNGHLIISYETPVTEPAPESTPTPSVIPTPEPSVVVEPTPTPTLEVLPEPTPTAVIEPPVVVAPTPVPSVVPTPEPSVVVEPTPEPTPTPEVIPEPTPTAVIEPPVVAAPTPVPSEVLTPEPTPEVTAESTPSVVIAPLALQRGSTMQISDMLSVTIDSAGKVSADLQSAYTGTVVIDLDGEQRFSTTTTATVCSKYKTVKRKKMCSQTKRISRTVTSSTCRLAKSITTKSRLDRQTFHLTSTCKLLPVTQAQLAEGPVTLQLKLNFSRTYADTGLAYRKVGKTKRNQLSVLRATYRVPIGS